MSMLQKITFFGLDSGNGTPTALSLISTSVKQLVLEVSASSVSNL